MTETVLTPLLVDPSLPPGWKRIVSQRSSGESAGKWDVYITGLGKRFRSRPELERFLQQKDIQDIDPKAIDFTVWGRDNKPARVAAKPKSPGSSAISEEKRRKLLFKKAAAAASPSNELANGCSATVLYVKFNFRRRAKPRERLDSVVSVDLSDDLDASYSAAPSPVSEEEEEDTSS